MHVSGPIITSAVVFGSMLILTILQSFGISQLELPYSARSVMVITGGGAMGFAASQLWLHLISKLDSQAGDTP
jgi:hypothetical protein